MLRCLVVDVVNNVTLVNTRCATKHVKQTEVSEIACSFSSAHAIEVSFGATRHTRKHDAGWQDNVARVHKQLFETGNGQHDVPFQDVESEQTSWQERWQPYRQQMVHGVIVGCNDAERLPNAVLPRHVPSLRPGRESVQQISMHHIAYGPANDEPFDNILGCNSVWNALAGVSL